MIKNLYVVLTQHQQFAGFINNYTITDEALPENEWVVGYMYILLIRDISYHMPYIRIMVERKFNIGAIVNINSHFDDFEIRGVFYRWAAARKFRKQNPGIVTIFIYT